MYNPFVRMASFLPMLDMEDGRGHPYMCTDHMALSIKLKVLT